MKRCARCREAKPREAFNKNRSKKDGLANWCRECAVAAKRAYNERNRERLRAEGRTRYADGGRERQRKWRAANPETVRAQRQRHEARRAHEAAARSARWRAQPGNRELANQRCRTYYAANRERLLAEKKTYKRDWYEQRGGRELAIAGALRRKARILKAFVEDVNHLVLLERDDGVCGICGGDVDPVDFHIDHILPLALGGEHSYANTQPAHPACNYRKGARALGAA